MITTNMMLGLLIPFAGTALGAAMVFFMRNELNPLIEKALLGFAGGVMMAASVWSLLIPSMEMEEAALGKLSFFPASVGFMIGIFGLLMLDHVIPHQHLNEEEPEGPDSLAAKLRKTTMMVLAVVIHNIPEGMAVGVVFAGIASSGAGITLASAFALSIGIAIQNFPEGAIISMPLHSEGMSKKMSFTYGMLSGIVEPIAAIITIMLERIMVPFLPYLLGFAGGAMVYVIVEELIPEASSGEHSNISTIGFAVGFVIMMILDCSLS